ncbi:hypothetical protein HZA38_06085 [Candidatus Peregrinibacteria bacterium]|nr:hypothetical protein [Candidatus Peregrinibacteria bacterium]
MKTTHKKLARMNMKIEEGLTLLDTMVMAAESVLIKNGTITPISFEKAFEHLKK